MYRECNLDELNRLAREHVTHEILFGIYHPGAEDFFYLVRVYEIAHDGDSWYGSAMLHTPYNNLTGVATSEPPFDDDNLPF